jgi:transposase InsO family protein
MVTSTRLGLMGDLARAKGLIDIKTRPRYPQSSGIVERFNGTVSRMANQQRFTEAA